MDFLDQIKLLFTLAFALWVIAAIVVTRMYTGAWFGAHDKRLPFIIGNIWFGVSMLVETGFYAASIWFEWRWAGPWIVRMIPTAAISQAIVYIIVGIWARKVGQNGRG